MKRYYRRKSDGQWTMRVDGNPVESAIRTEIHANAEYGFPVESLDVADDGDPREGSLLAPPTPPPSPRTPLQEALAELDAATTIVGVKAAVKKALEWRR